MAATDREKSKEDFLRCIECSEYYRDPCTLRCHHSFCRKCLSEHIKNCSEATGSKTIVCPSCSQKTSVPDSTRPVGQWADQLEPSLVLLGLTGRAHYGKRDLDPGIGPGCNTCKERGEITECTSLCHDCYLSLCDRCKRVHLANTSSQNHDVADLVTDIEGKKRTVLCREHKDEFVRFHCSSCNKSACQTCCTVYHKTCRSVETLESMKSVIMSSLCEKRHVMSKRCKLKSMKIGEIETAVINSSQNQMKIISEITTVCQEAVDKIRQKEKELIEELAEATGKQIGKLQADMKTELSDMQVYQQHCAYIDRVLKSDCVMDMYDTSQSCTPEAVVLESNRETDTRRIINDICFINSTEELHNVLDDIGLGEISLTYDEERNPMSTPVLYNTFNENNCHDVTDIIGLFVDDVHAIVVADNGCVKSFFTRNDIQSQSTLPLDNSPFSIAKLKENKVMVTVPEARQIVTIDVTPELVSVSTITASHRYWGLAVLGPTTLAACGMYPVGVHLLNMEGQVMKSVSTPFDWPWYMCLDNKGNLLVSDCKKRSVTCLTPEGDFLWTFNPTGYTKLKQPRGVTTTSGGEILLVDCDLNKMIQLTESGRYVRDVLSKKDGLSDPRGIYMDGYSSLFLCSQDLKEYLFI